MKGIILAGGHGSRLRPLTYATSKMLLPVYDRPMIYYPIQTLLEAGIDDILIILGGPFAGHFFNVLKDGKHLGIKNLQYMYQDGFAGPMDALKQAESFADGDAVVIMMGDQVTDGSLAHAVANFKSGAMLLLQKYMDPEGMGVPEFDPNDSSKILAIEENPSEPKSEYAATGIYIYDNRCFSFIDEHEGKVEGEIKPTHVNNRYLGLGELHWEPLNGFWVDAGKFDRLYEANKYFAEKAGQ